MKHYSVLMLALASSSSLFFTVIGTETSDYINPENITVIKEQLSLSQEPIEQKKPNVETQKNTQELEQFPFKKKRNIRKKKISFDFVGKPLVEIVNEVAAHLELNIIFPQGAVTITTKVTFHPPNPKITLLEAWQRTISFLDLAGYTIRPEGSALVILKSDTKNVVREPFNLYVDEALDNLPDTEEIIRCIFYLTNLSIKVSGADIKTILQDMLSQNADIQLEQKTNAIILTDKANNIKGVMKIIKELDQGGIRDAIEVLPLYYTTAQILDDLFNKQLLTQPAPIGGPAPQGIQSSYFPKNTKILALDRTNSLVIMGTPHAIDLVKDFIIKYIDRPLESGESILHVYELKYLNAQQFAPILQNIVNPAQASGQTTGKAVAGPRQYFKDVIVQAELVRKTEQIAPSAPGGETQGSSAPKTEGTQIGGNRLVIAARKQDWVRIKKLIEDLDKPQPQVALEVLVVDLTLSTNKIFGNQMRDKQGLKDSLSQAVNYQSAQLAAPVLSQETVPLNDLEQGTALGPNALMANLLQLNADGNNLANLSTPGTTVIALKDAPLGGVWSVWRILDQFGETSILAQPFVVTTNHQQATVTIQQDRLLVGSADTQNTAVSQQFEHQTAGLSIDILPHISLTNNVNLQITVQVNEFAGANDNTKITRVVQTSSNVGNGQILALGGLIRNSNNIDVSQVPILGSIPLLGWWFKRETKVIERNNLLIFICPTIIEPRLKGGIDTFTQKKLGVAECNLDEHLNFENLRDPITRWFFKPNRDYAQNVIDSYSKHAITQTYEHGGSELMSGIVELTRAEKPTAKSIKHDMFHENAENLKTLVKNESNPLDQGSSKETIS
jgi:general secretion pathway protein D